MGARALKIAAVVLNWKRADETIACVRSILQTSPETDVIVVDNASGNGSVERIKVAFQNITLIENAENLGYAGGNNVGIRSALATDADAVFVLNNDVLVRPFCIQTLIAALEHDQKLGIVAPMSLLADGETIDHVGGKLDLKWMALSAPGRDAAWHGGVEPIAPDYVTGSAMLIRRLFFADVDPFDERFFLVWEDVDLCLRARQSAIGRIAVFPTAHVVHARSVSFGGQGSALYQYFYVRNSFLIVEKHARPWRKRKTRALLERRYGGWLDKPETTPALRDAIELGLHHGLSSIWGPTPPELRA